ncbi:MAG: S-layer homology domain-containing protein, partial [Clostridia bacterium]|nr:S-layer homology domain-containing protein [Clostridia bacterium]
KPATAQYTYTFVAWSPVVGPVTGDITYTAVFSDGTTNTYTITWKDEDGTVLGTDTLEYGATPSREGPTKEATAEFTYTFDKWTPEVAPVTGEATYTASYTSVTNAYTVTWKNYDGSVLETDEGVLYGATPAYDGETPVKPATAQYTYTFVAWSPVVGPVTGDITYTAVFSDGTTNTYTITWKDEDGSVLGTDTLEYGATPSREGPTKAADEDYTYAFSKWTPDIVAVAADATYTAVYTATPIEKPPVEPTIYTITWKQDDGTIIDTTTVEEGTLPTHDDPSKAADEDYTYTFSKWTPDIVAVTGAATYTAVYTATPIEKPPVTPTKYTITWKQDDGSIIDTTTVEEGAVPTHDDPTKAADEDYTYAFSKWTPDLTAATADATYTAVYTATAIGGDEPPVVEPKERRVYTITFDPAGGTALAAIEYHAYDDMALPESARDNYDFAGWIVTQAKGKWEIGETIEPGQRASLRYGDVTLTALWKQTVHPEKLTGPQLNMEEHNAYIAGYPDGTFRPDKPITRAEAAGILYSLLTPASIERYGTSDNAFSDVSSDDWYNDAVSTLANAGVLTGFPDGTFRPNEVLSRAQIAGIAASFSGLQEGESAFTDVLGHWAYKAIVTAELSSWVGGYPDGTFRPDRGLTRAEAVTILNKVLGRHLNSGASLPEGMATISDNMDPNAWYYYEIQEALNGHGFEFEEDGSEVWTELK